MNYQNSKFKRDNLFHRNHLHNHPHNHHPVYSIHDHSYCCNKQCSRSNKTIDLEYCITYSTRTVCSNCKFDHCSGSCSSSKFKNSNNRYSMVNKFTKFDNHSHLNKFCRDKFNRNHHIQKSPFKIYFIFFKLLSFLNWKFNNHNHTSKSYHRNFNLLPFLLIALLSFNKLTSAQQSTCPNAKQISDLKPLNVNLNCDCTQTADGQKAGWEIMCYSVENLNVNSGKFFGSLFQILLNLIICIFQIF